MGEGQIWLTHRVHALSREEDRVLVPVASTQVAVAMIAYGSYLLIAFIISWNWTWHEQLESKEGIGGIGHLRREDKV